MMRFVMTLAGLVVLFAAVSGWAQGIPWDGLISVDCSMITMDPESLVFDASNAISFNVIDSHEENSARGEYTKDMPGIVRPLLDWETTFESH